MMKKKSNRRGGSFAQGVIVDGLWSTRVRRLSLKTLSMIRATSELASPAPGTPELVGVAVMLANLPPERGSAEISRTTRARMRHGSFVGELCSGEIAVIGSI